MGCHLPEEGMSQGFELHGAREVTGVTGSLTVAVEYRLNLRAPCPQVLHSGCDVLQFLMQWLWFL